MRKMVKFQTNMLRKFKINIDQNGHAAFDKLKKHLASEMELTQSN